MKVFLAIALSLSTQLFAAQLTNIQEMTNKSLETERKEILKNYIVTHSAIKKITLVNENEVNDELKREALFYTLNYACPFFQEASFQKSDVQKSVDTLVDRMIDRTHTQYTALTNSLTNVSKMENVEIYSGNGSGRLNYGTIVGLFDSVNNEVAVFANTNCGSEH
jgi:vacuolar-type H+-ATPase catalytic subunit A/Vma1